MRYRYALSLTNFIDIQYDEWSSEARDIFAITLPDEYKWSFLTLSKKGEQLCERMKKRIEDLMSRPPEERPEWCPSVSTSVFR